MPLTSLQEKFVLHWGEMGTRWGINRTVAQIHALLYISERPLDAEEIAKTLEVARSNVSNSIRDLQAYGVIKTIHVMGERREKFECMKDVWEMFRMILDERKRREADPTLVALREITAAAKVDSAEAYMAQRLDEMSQCLELVNNWYESTRKMSTPAVIKLCKLGNKVAKLLGISG